MHKSERLFHYTTALSLEPIMKSGKILPATKYVPAGEKPAVWLSLEPEWEPTANKKIMLPDGSSVTPRGIEELSGYLTPIRFEVLPEYFSSNWNDFKRQSGIDPKTAQALELVAYDQRADPSKWRISFKPISSDFWVSIEGWVDGKWVSIATKKANA